MISVTWIDDDRHDFYPDMISVKGIVSHIPQADSPQQKKSLGFILYLVAYQEDIHAASVSVLAIMFLLVLLDLLLGYPIVKLWVRICTFRKSDQVLSTQYDRKYQYLD